MAIESETKFLWRLLLDIIKTPFLFFLVLFGKRDSSVLWQPLRDLGMFLVEAKLTFWLLVITTAATVYAWTLPASTFNLLLSYPHDLFVPSRWYSFISAAFIHANLTHLAGNMLALFVFGRIVERKLGTLKTLGVYFVSMVVSGIAAAAIGLSANIPGLGASGAIMGFVSASMLLDPFYISWDALIPLPAMALGWLYLYLDLSSFATNDNINHAAHLGGYFSVLLLLFFFTEEDRSKLVQGIIINVASALVVFFVFVFVLHGNAAAVSSLV